LGKVGDLRKSVHIVLDLTDYMWVKDSLGEQPVPDDKELLAGRLVGGVENGSAFVLNPGAEKFANDLEGLVGIRIKLARFLASLGQLGFHGGGELGFRLYEDRALWQVHGR